MRNFIFGVVVTLVLLVVVEDWPLPCSASCPRMRIPVRRAWSAASPMSAMDASMERHAPRVTNPVPPTDDNLIDGMKIYTMNCAFCHGALDNKPSALQRSFYPPPPQLILHPLDDPEWHIYYAVRTGIRYTGMPAWNKALSDQEMWKVTAFLSRIEKLPPAVQDYWKKSTGSGAARRRS